MAEEMGDRLERQRTKVLKLSREKMVDRLMALGYTVTERTLYNYEKNIRVPTSDDLPFLAAGYEMSVGEILTGLTKMGPVSEDQLSDEIISIRYRSSEYRISREKMISAMSIAIQKLIDEGRNERSGDQRESEQRDDRQDNEYDQTGTDKV